EYVAAHVAGVFSLEDAFGLLLLRSELMGALPAGGAMLALQGPAPRLAALCGQLPAGLEVAAFNSPEALVVAGPQDAIEALARQCDGDGIVPRQLPVSHAFHSAAMAPVLTALTAGAASLRLQAPALPLASNVSGELAGAELALPGYWAKQVRQPVRFEQGVQALARAGHTLFLELGPRPVLSHFVRAAGSQLTALPSLAPGKALATLAGTLAALHVRGADIAWQDVLAHEPVRPTPLPAYPFNRAHYWAIDLETNHMSFNTTHSEPAESRRNDARKADIATALGAMFAELLGQPGTALNDSIPLMQLGADSFVMTAAIKRIHDTWQVKLSMRELFERYLTIGSIAERLLESPAPAQAGVAAPPSRPAVSASTPAAIPASIPVAVTMPPTDATVLHRIKAMFAELLGQPGADLDEDAPLMQLGADSFVMTAAIKRIADTWGVKLSMREMFEQYLTIASIAGRLGNVPAGRPVPAAPEPAPATAAPLAAPRFVTPPAAPTTPSFAAPAAPRAGYTPPAFSAAPATVAPAGLPAWLAGSTLDGRQQRYLTDFVARYTAKTAGSKALAQGSRAVLCNNRRSSSGFRLETKELAYPIVATESAGARLRDTDGNEYVDLAMGFGATLFGHRPEFVTEALTAQLAKGFQIGPENAMAHGCAELIKQATGVERVLFCNSGTEATMTALRIGRAATRRPKVVLFQNAYHGHSDGTMVVSNPEAQEGGAMPMVLGTPQSMVDDVIVLPFADMAAIDLIRRHAHEIGAVMVEPVQNRRPDLHPREFLHALREVTAKHGIVLIFDEILVGFRIALGGAQQWFGVEADMVTYGKVIGGGLPLGAVTGRAWCMDKVDGGAWRFGDQSAPDADTTYTAGTFCKHPLAMAAAHATLTEMLRHGPALQQQLNARAERLGEVLNEVFAAHAVPLRMHNFGSFFRFSQSGNLSFVYQPLELDLFFYHLIEKGVYVWEGRTCFISTAHTDADMDHIVRAVNDSVAELKAAGFWQASSDAPRGPGGGKPHSSILSRATVAAAAPAPAVAPHPVPSTVAAARPAPRPDWPSALVDPRFIATRANAAQVQFSLYYFGNCEDGSEHDKYDFLLEGARFADRAGFTALWLPERHFDSFGGFSPNPAVVAAALARETSRIDLRASVLLPLHHPVRVAEEWSVVDNLARGRTGIAFASGWHVNDFVLNPDAWGNNRDAMIERIGTVQRLWLGETVTLPGPQERQVSLKMHPRPVRDGLPMWLTTLGNKEVYEIAGRMGVGILTNLLGQKIEDVAENIALYRAARAQAGLDPAGGHVTVLVHTLVGHDLREVREQARAPFCRYLGSSLGLFQKMVQSEGLAADFDALTADDRAFLLNAAYERYADGSALIGTPDSCAAVVERLVAAGVNEVACFVDFGVDHGFAAQSFGALGELRQRFDRSAPAPFNAGSVAPIVVRDTARLQEAPAASAAAPAVAAGAVAGERKLPLSDDQRMLLFLTKFGDDGMLAFSQTSVLALDGSLDAAALERAYGKVTSRHDALRMTIDEATNELVIHPVLAHPIAVVDLRSLPQEQAEQQLQALLQLEAQTPYDLQHGLHRLTLLTTGERRWVLVLSAHHLAVDGSSIGVFLGELAALYRAETGDPCAPALVAQPLQVGDHLAWRAGHMDGTAMRQQEAFWLAAVRDLPAPPELPIDRARPPVKTYAGDRVTVALDAQFYTRLQEFGRQEGCTYFMVALGAFAILLHRLGRHDEVAIGVPFSGRGLPGGEHIIGYLSNVYPVVSRLSAGMTGRDYLQALKASLLDVYDNQEYPFSALVSKALPVRDASRAPFFSVAFNWDRVTLPAMPGLTVAPLPWRPRYVEFELMPNLMEVDGAVEIAWDYNTDLFDRETVAQLAAQFSVLLRELVDAPLAPVAQLPLLDDTGRAAVLAKAGNSAPAPAGQTLSQLLDDCAARHPKRVAARCGQRAITYADLAKGANRIANHLKQYGIGAGAVVAIACDPSIEQLLAIHGVLKAGAAYLPLNLRYPAERLRAIMDDAGAAMLLHQADVAQALLADDRRPKALLDEPMRTFKAASSRQPEAAQDAAGLAYLMYTSGSSGTPKGVRVTQHNVMRFAGAALAALDMTGGETWLNVAPTAFDMSVPDFFLPLFGAGCCVIATADERLAPRCIMALLDEHRVDFMQATPTMWRMLVNDEWRGSMRLRICAGGELLDAALARRLLALGHSLWNGYGPTETTVWSNLLRIEPRHLERALVPVGPALPHLAVHVVDPAGQPVPEGHLGEVLIAGDGVAAGYLGNDELNRARFVADPFGPGRAYRSGDLGRYRANGGLDIVGRVDEQVKLRGFRVELGEIDAALLRLAGVREAASVLQASANGEASIVSHVCLAGQAATSGAALRQELKALLPDYMVPSLVNIVDALPHSANGKVDRRRLPVATAAPADDRPFVAPASADEQALAQVFGQVLGVAAVGRDDDFFELGGSSLQLAQLQGAIQAALGVALRITQLFQYTTVAQLAALLPSARGEDGVATAPAAHDGAAVAPAARRLLPALPSFRYHAEQFGYRHHFNLAKLFRVIAPALTRELLEQAWQDVVRHHEALCLQLWQHDGRWQQRVGDGAAVPLRFCDLAGLPANERTAALERHAAGLQTGFRLEQGAPLCSATWFAMGDGEPARLLLICHFGVTDAYGFQLVVEDLLAASEARIAGRVAVLPPSSAFSEWLLRYHQYANGEALAEASHWLGLPWQHCQPLVLDAIGDEEAAARLATLSDAHDYASLHALLTGGGDATSLHRLSERQAIHYVELPAAATAALNDAVRRLGSGDLVDALLLAWHDAWSDRMRAGTLAVDFMFSNRKPQFPGVDVARTVMRAAENVTLLLAPDTSASAAERLAAVAAARRQHPRNGIGLPALRYLCDDAAMARRMAALPLPQIGFNYLSLLPAEQGKVGDLLEYAAECAGPCIDYRTPAPRRVACQLYVDRAGAGTVFALAYDPRQLRHASVVRVAERFLQCLNSLSEPSTAAV
ncbi:non-ribosomal peptide synthetase, partial [Pseudoduganella buxea]